MVGRNKVLFTLPLEWSGKSKVVFSLPQNLDEQPLLIQAQKQSWKMKKFSVLFLFAALSHLAHRSFERIRLFQILFAFEIIQSKTDFTGCDLSLRYEIYRNSVFKSVSECVSLHQSRFEIRAA